MSEISSAYLEELSNAASHTHTKIELEVSEAEENLNAKRQTLLLNCFHNPRMLWWAPLLTQPMDAVVSSPTFKFKKK